MVPAGSDGMVKVLVSGVEEPPAGTVNVPNTVPGLLITTMFMLPAPTPACSALSVMLQAPPGCVKA